jgi:hypothetical protein
MRPTKILLVLGLLTLGSGAARSAVAEDGPDLALDVPRMESTARVMTGIYHEPGRAPALDATVPVSGTCVLDPDENCVGGPGIRKLLRFDVLVHNVGTQDLVIGNPKDLPDLFVYSACHRHYHFKGAALYELLDPDGNVVKTGRKQGFCIEDTLPSSSATTTPKHYDCTNQGIQVGWADWYPSILDCQWIDVTDLPAGPYQLHVSWNPKHLMGETNFDNNEGTVPVTIPAPTDPPPVVDAITSPTARTVAAPGRLLDVSWSAHDDTGIVTQEVWASSDGGNTWKEIVGDVPGDKSRFRWMVPPTFPPGQTLIKVVARDGSVQHGELVSAPFRVVTPASTRLPRRSAAN